MSLLFLSTTHESKLIGRPDDVRWFTNVFGASITGVLLRSTSPRLDLMRDLA